MKSAELIAYLATAGYTVYPDANYIPAELPETKLPCLFVMGSGGFPPHAYVPTRRPTYQIIVKGKSYKALPANMTATEALANELIGVLHGKANYSMGSTYVLSSTATTEAIYLGLDSKDHPMYSTNFELYVKEAR